MKNPIRKGKTLGLAAVCFAICIGGVLTMTKQSGWHRSTGQVVAITLECGMRARQGDYVYTKDIPCEMVEAFKLVNADKEWRVTEKYQSTVQFADADGVAATTQMTLYTRDGQTPTVGDTFLVLQNPDDPAEVVRPDAWMTTLLTAGSGMLGAAILFFFFRGKQPVRKHATPTLDEAADESERAKRADAMIAAALARQKDEKRTVAQPMVRRVNSPPARAGFGRKH